jgi:hypothetical protein
MASLADILSEMRNNPAGVKFSALQRICDHYFWAPRIAKGSHRIHKTPWSGNPGINIQNDRGHAKGYQVKLVPEAIERLEIVDKDEK